MFDFKNISKPVNLLIKQSKTFILVMLLDAFSISFRTKTDMQLINLKNGKFENLTLIDMPYI